LTDTSAVPLHFLSLPFNLGFSQPKPNNMPPDIKTDAKPEKKHDPFRPVQPAIPGVPANASTQKVAPKPARQSAVPAAKSEKPAQPAKSSPLAPDEPKSQMLAIGICLIAVALLAGMLIAWKLHQPAQSASATVANGTPAASDALPGDAPKVRANIPIAPGVVATTDELAKPWSSKSFIWRDPLTNESAPALVVHLPNGSYWGFSMVEPFGNCQLEYLTNLDRLQSEYDFRSDHPMVVDPCNHAVFDLLQYGGASGDAVRGALVHGMGVRPPLAIEIEQHGKEIRAIRME
jgi:hypothetical protein